MSSFPNMYKPDNVSNRPITALKRSQSLPNHQQLHQDPLVSLYAKASAGQQKMMNSFANPLIHKMESQIRFPVLYLLIENPNKSAYPKISFKTKKKISFNQYLHNNTNEIATNQNIETISKQDECKIDLLSPPKPINKSLSTAQNPFASLNYAQRQQNTIWQINYKDSSMLAQNALKKIAEIDENNQDSLHMQVGIISSDESQIACCPRLSQSIQFSENNSRKLKKPGIQLTN